MKEKRETQNTKSTEEVITEETQEVQEVKSVKEDKSEKFKPGIGTDIGTSNVVMARQTEDGTFVNRYHRNMLYPLNISDESADLLDRSDYLYVKSNGKYYIVGEDALRLVNAIGKGEVVRPMKDGILNPQLKESSELLFYIIKAIIGEPIVEKETLRFSIPANPIDKPDINNLFHSKVLENFFIKMGYDARPVNEAMAIAFDSLPVTITDEEEVPLSGISISFGGGMINVALCYKGLELNSFSITKSGDEIDKNVAQVTGVTQSKIIKIKEKTLDLDNINMSDRVQSGLSIYYDEMIDRVIHYMSEEFINRKSEIDGKVDIIIAGGTSCPNGFNKRLEESIKRNSFPFEINRIRSATEKFHSVSQGCCIRARADWERKNK